MDNADKFIEMVEGVLPRRGMFFCGQSFYEVCAYIAGYSSALPDSPLGGDGWGAFNAYVCAKI